MPLNQSLALSPNRLTSPRSGYYGDTQSSGETSSVGERSRISSSRGEVSDSGGSSSYSTQTIDSQQGIGITVRLSVESYRPGECGPQWFMKSQQFNCSSESQYSKFENHSLPNDSDNSKVALSNLPVNYAHHRTDITLQQSSSTFPLSRPVLSSLAPTRSKVYMVSFLDVLKEKLKAIEGQSNSLTTPSMASLLFTHTFGDKPWTFDFNIKNGPQFDLIIKFRSDDISYLMNAHDTKINIFKIRGSIGKLQTEGFPINDCFVRLVDDVPKKKIDYLCRELGVSILSN